MTTAWICKDFPIHGAFLQETLDRLGQKAEVSTALNVVGLDGSKAREQLVARHERGEKAMRRYACPVCLAFAAKTGKSHAGAFVRPATEIEAAKAA